MKEIKGDSGARETEIEGKATRWLKTRKIERKII